MNPYFFKPLFDLLHLPYIGAYFSMMAISYILSFPLIYLIAPRLGIDRNRMYVISIVTFVSALIGSKIFHVFFDTMFSNYLSMIKEKGFLFFLLHVLHPFKGGHVFYGGLAGGFIAASVTAALFYRNKEKVLQVYNVTIFPILLGLALTRIGCFLHGCCYGIPSEMFGVQFPAGSLASFGLHQHGLLESFFDLPPRLFPAQLLESAGNFIILGVLIRVFMKSETHLPGFYFFKGVLFYSVMRFLIEFLRYDPRSSFLHISASQWISLLLITGSFFALKKIQKIGEK